MKKLLTSTMLVSLALSLGVAYAGYINGEATPSPSDCTRWEMSKTGNSKFCGDNQTNITSFERRPEMRAQSGSSMSGNTRTWSDPQSVNTGFGETAPQRNFENQMLNRAEFNRDFLPWANFKQAQLNSAEFRGANLSNANFTGAMLMGADLRWGKFHGANFAGADLTNARLHGAKFQDAKFDKFTKFPQKFIPEQHGMIEIK